jgi:hypothetical protein
LPLENPHRTTTPLTPVSILGIGESKREKALFIGEEKIWFYSG